MAARLWQTKITAEGMLKLNPAQCTVRIKNCQRFAGVQVLAEHSYRQLYSGLRNASVLHAAAARSDCYCQTA